jgi:hypothetical protein
VITEVTVALLPDPSASRTGLAYFDSLTQAGRAVSGILAAGVIPSTLEFLDRSCIDAVEQYAHLGLHPDAGALLLFGDDGDEAAVARSFERITAVCEDSGAIAVQTAGDATESEALLTARRCTLPALARVALQDSCHLRNGLGVWREPRALLSAIAEYVELPGAGRCCGAAGTYALVRPRDSRRVLNPKLDAIEEAGIDYVVAVNPGCLRQLRQGLHRRKSKVRAVHIADLLRLAASLGRGRRAGPVVT